MLFSQHDELVTHLGCMDGSLCAVVFQLFGGNKNNIIFSSPAHEKVDSVVLENRKNPKGKLYLADISISEKTAESLNERDDILVIDHHKSAVPLDKYDWCQIDTENKSCGAKLFLQYCKDACSGKLPDRTTELARVIDAVDDRDRWINKHPKSADLSELFYALGQDRFTERVINYPHLHFRMGEQAVIEWERAKRKSTIEGLKPIIMEAEGYRFGFVACDVRYTSDAGHYLCDHHNLDCCLLLSDQIVSMRAPSHSRIDCSALAKKFSGGGHRCAAGFQLKELIGKTFTEHVAKAFINHITG